MCKLFMMTSLEKLKINGKFLNTINQAVTRTGDDHAFGYSILGTDKEGYFLGGERTEEPSLFRALGPAPDTIRASKLDRVKISNNRFGRLDTNKALSIVAHGRFSTNERLLRSAHPFVSDDTTLALAHNGVVRDTVFHNSPVEKLLTTKCDTEILLRYWELGGIEAVEKNVGGYYAMGILDSVDGTLHVVKDSRASLVITYSDTVESYIIATTADIIKEISKEMKWKIDPILMIKDNSYIVFRGNEVIQSDAINPKKDYYNHNTSGAFGNGHNRTRYTGYNRTEYKPESKGTAGAATEVKEEIKALSESVKETVENTDTTVIPPIPHTEMGPLPETEHPKTMAEMYAEDDAAYYRALRDMSMDTTEEMDLDDEPYYRRKEKGSSGSVTRYTGNNGEQIEYDRETGKTKYWGGWE